MIRELILERFGKFKDRTFKFSDVTVFYGVNESGKTTIFDALLICLCKVSKTNKLMKAIYARYGENCKAMIKPTGNVSEKYDINEFMNLNAVRSGELNFNMSEGGWMDRVKADLFSGGVDPLHLAGIFEKLSSDDGKLSFNKEMRELEEEISVIEKKLSGLNDRKMKLIDGNDNGDRLKNEIENLKNKINDLANQKDKIESDLSMQEKVGEKIKFKSVLADVYRQKDLEVTLQSMHEYVNDDLKPVKEWENELNILTGKSEATVETIKNLRSNMIMQKSKKPELQNGTFDTISFMTNQLNGYRNNPYYKDRIFLKIRYIIPGMIASISSLIPIFIFDQKWVLLATFSLLTLSAFLSVGKEKIPDAEKENVLIKKIKDEAVNRAFVTLNSRTVSGLYEELLKKKIELENEMKSVGEHESRMRDLQDGIDRAEMSKKDHELRCAVLKDKIDLWYTSRGVKNIEEYLKNKNRYYFLNDELERTNERIDAYKTDLNIRDMRVLKSECERKLKIMDDDCISDIGMHDAELNGKKMLLKKLGLELDLMNRRREELENKFAGNAGFFKANITDLPEEIAEYERRISTMKKKLSDLRLTKKSAAELKIIFGDMADGSDALLKELSEEIKKHFSMILPEMREVSMENLNANSILVDDALGVPRNIDHLSRGTKESFLFAAKLLFSIKSNAKVNTLPAKVSALPAKKNTSNPRDNNIILLDEPFNSFDEQRERKSLEMLKYFSENLKYQIVIFTKEKRIVDESKNIFKENLTVYNL